MRYAMVVFVVLCSTSTSFSQTALTKTDPDDTPTTAATVTASPLDDLAWMVGTWVDRGDEVVITTDCSWTHQGKFLSRSFTIREGDELTLEGTQTIGWDPLEGRIRSWTFDSEGGRGEGRWYQDGDRWLVKTSFVLANGERASSINVITRIDENTMGWQSTNREIAGELQPNIPEVTVVRQTNETETPKDKKDQVQ